MYMKAGTWFDRLVKQELIRRDPTLPFGDLSVSDEIDSSIKAMAQGAFNRYAGYLSRFSWLKVEYTCTKVLNGITILGKPDACVSDSSSSIGTFDWKLSTKLQTPGRTGLGKWNDQMWIYCWLQDHEWACIHNVDYTGACREFRACPDGSKIKADLEDYVSWLGNRKCFIDDVDDWGRQSLLYEGMLMTRAR
jgi:hypothetical protein